MISMCKQAAQCMSERLDKMVQCKSGSGSCQGTSLVATTCRQSSKATLSKQCKSLQMPFLKVLQQTGEV